MLLQRGFTKGATNLMDTFSDSMVHLGSTGHVSHFLLRALALPSVDKNGKDMFTSEVISLTNSCLGYVVASGSASQPTWYRARQCDSGACVEVGILGESVLIRSSTDPGDTCISFGRGGWRTFVAGVKGGDFDGLRLSQVRRRLLLVSMFWPGCAVLGSGTGNGGPIESEVRRV